MGYYEFPHTRNYDTDLGYLIKRYFELGNDFESLEKNFNDLKAWCIAQLNSEALKTLVANKLDEWLEDGTLASLINDPLLHITSYDTVVEMIAHSGLEIGAKIYCTGADTINDGKGGHFRIRARLSTDIIDNYNLYLVDGSIKVAERIGDRDKSVYVTPEEYGAIGDGVTDDTQAFINALENNDTLICNGTYKISKTGTFTWREFTKDYCIELKDGKNIIGGKFLAPANSVLFYAGNNTTIKNIEVTFEVPTERILHTHFAVLTNTKTNVKVENVTVLEGGVVGFMDSTNCIATNCYRSCVVSTTNKVGSSYLIFGGERNKIEKCITYGGTYDGDISIYTGIKHQVLNCIASAYTTSGALEVDTLQGITVDAGAKEILVDGCYVSGYYYGIDIKSSAVDNVVTNCYCENNKVSVCSRLGELNQTSFEVTINNISIITGGNGNQALINNHKNIGIYVESTSHANISNITIKGNDTSFCGFCIESSKANISNVKVSKTYDFGSTHYGFLGEVIRVNNGILLCENIAINGTASQTDTIINNIGNSTITINNMFVDNYCNNFMVGNGEYILNNIKGFFRNVFNTTGDVIISNSNIYFMTEYAVTPFNNTGKLVFTDSICKGENTSLWLTNSGSAAIVSNVMYSSSMDEPNITTSNKIVNVLKI